MSIFLTLPGTLSPATRPHGSSLISGPISQAFPDHVFDEQLPARRTQVLNYPEHSAGGCAWLLGTGLTSELPFPYLSGGLTATLQNCCEDRESENTMCLEECLELTVGSAPALEGSGSGGGRPAEAGEAP